jgi:hypothetical protein
MWCSLFVFLSQVEKNIITFFFFETIFFLRTTDQLECSSLFSLIWGHIADDDLDDDRKSNEKVCYEF